MSTTTIEETYWTAEVSGPWSGGMFGDEQVGDEYMVEWTHPEQPAWRVTTYYGVCSRPAEERFLLEGEQRAYLEGRLTWLAGEFEETEHGVLFTEAPRYRVDEMTVFEHDDADWGWEYADTDSIIYGDGSYLDYADEQGALAQARSMARREAGFPPGYGVMGWTPWATA